MKANTFAKLFLTENRFYKGDFMYFKTREEELSFMKKLWQEEKVSCPKCGHEFLEHLHKKAKKSNCDWKCSNCGEIFRTIGMLKELQEE